MTTINPDMIRTILAETDDVESLRRRLEALLPAPTMADVEWDDDAHAGLCAVHEDGSVVRMLGLDPEDDDYIQCMFSHENLWVTNSLHRANLIPVPGTKLDLTPRRAPGDGPEDTAVDTPAVPRPEDVPDGETWQVEYYGVRYVGMRNDPRDRDQSWVVTRAGYPGWGWASDSEVTLIRRMVPETVDHSSGGGGRHEPHVC